MMHFVHFFLRIFPFFEKMLLNKVSKSIRKSNLHQIHFLQLACMHKTVVRWDDGEGGGCGGWGGVGAGAYNI